MYNYYEAYTYDMTFISAYCIGTNSLKGNYFF